MSLIPTLICGVHEKIVDLKTYFMLAKNYGRVCGVVLILKICMF